MTELHRFNRVRPPRKPRRVVMRFSSLNDLARRNMDSYLLIERPPRQTWSSTTYQERMDARPPLKADMEGPTPCTYSASLPTNAVHGTKINPLTKYDRGALPNPTTDIWTYNISQTPKAPDPGTYPHHNVFGQHCPVVKEAPAFSLTSRRTQVTKVENQVSPSSYDPIRSMKATLTHHPAFTMATRINQTKSTPSPGPAHYYPLHTLTKQQSPAFSMRQRRHSRTWTF